MKLSLACLTAFVLPGALAQLNMSQADNAIASITTYAYHTETALDTLSASTPPCGVLDMTQNLVLNLTTEINLLENLTSETIVSPVPEWQDEIVLAYSAFVDVHMDFCNALTSKHPIFAQFQVTKPIEVVLRKLSPRLNALADALTNMLPRDANSVTYLQAQLNGTVQSTITTYEEKCVPSSEYPGVMPNCGSMVM